MPTSSVRIQLKAQYRYASAPATMTPARASLIKSLTCKIETAVRRGRLHPAGVTVTPLSRRPPPERGRLRRDAEWATAELDLGAGHR